MSSSLNQHFLRRFNYFHCCQVCVNFVRGTHKYQNTLCLPKTEFEFGLKDAHKKEISLQKKELFTKLYNCQREFLSRPEFILHDGPPYANGSPHVGHALNKILKDIINRYKLLTGYRINYIPGWDCHGLPIEHQVLKNFNNELQKSPLVIREKAGEFAKKFVSDQMMAFQRWGVMANWSEPYLTMDPSYEAKQLQAFWTLYRKNLIYRDFMPVFWSPSSRSALAEAELEYDEYHVSSAAYVRFPVVHIPDVIRCHLGNCQNVYAVSWTTTPWTLPANEAICFKADAQYAFVIFGKVAYLTSASSIHKLESILGRNHSIKLILGAELSGMLYRSPLYPDYVCPFLPADHVTADLGTGLVHTAPSHGRDDFQISIAHSLPVRNLIGEDGIFLDSVMINSLVGKQVPFEANKAVLEECGDDVLQVEDHVHSYPYDWRTKQPVITRASQQWFIDNRSLKIRAQECLDEVDVYPSVFKNVLKMRLEERPYWCISRQRCWGVPIPVFYKVSDNSPIINRSTIDHITTLISKHGSDCWWNMDTADLLPSDLTLAGISSVDEVEKGTDILDIWLDSGLSWNCVLSDKQADVYLEGLDQIGAWFQSSLLTSVALQDRAPFKKVVIHGFVVDENGKKMSKSEGNVVEPSLITDRKFENSKFVYGADVLRYWAALSGLSSKVYMGSTVMQRCHDSIYKIRKTLKFLLGNLYRFQPPSDLLKYDDLLVQDKYMLHLTHCFENQVRNAYNCFDLSTVISTIKFFVTEQVSNFYCTIIKDRCYCDEQYGHRRRSCQTVQYHILHVLASSLAPVLPHLVEDLNSHLLNLGAYKESYFHGLWTLPDPEWEAHPLSSDFGHLMKIRKLLCEGLATKPARLYDVYIEPHGHFKTLIQVYHGEGCQHFSVLMELLHSASVSIVDGSMVTTDDDIIVESEGAGSTDYFKLIIRQSQCYPCERCRRLMGTEKETLCYRCEHTIALQASRESL